MKEPVITDSTCLIGLERIEHLDLLSELFEPVTIPPEVAKEFGISLPWLRVQAPTDIALIDTLKILVDDGEAEAIALASELQQRIIVDDRQARAVARNIDLKIIGTIGVLVKARQSHIISQVRPLIEELETNGFYIGQSLKEEALRLVGE